MIRRSAGHLGLDTLEPKLRQSEFVHKDIDRTNGIVLVNPIFQEFRKQHALRPIRVRTEAPPASPPQIAWESYLEDHFNRRVFTQPGLLSTELGSSCHVRYTFNSDRAADIRVRQPCHPGRGGRTKIAPLI
jgi:hypothetical protein